MSFSKSVRLPLPVSHYQPETLKFQQKNPCLTQYSNQRSLDIKPTLQPIATKVPFR
jgi:hypothetical protein